MSDTKSVAERLRRAAFTLYSGEAVSLSTALQIIAEAEEKQTDEADLCENCDGTTEVTTELTGFATVAFCLTCWNKEQQRIAQLKQEKATLRAALTTALEGLEDMLPYVPAYFAEKWKHQEYVEGARQALAASKEADDGNDLTNSGDHE